MLYGYGKGITLQGRIVAFTIIFAVLLISSFTIIQLHHQIKTTTDYNIYRSKVSVLFIKVTLEKIFDSAGPETDIGASLDRSLSSFQKGGLIEHGFIVAENNHILASTNPSQIGKPVPPGEDARIGSAFKNIGLSKEMLNYADWSSRTMFIYIPVAPDNDEKYIARAAFALGNLQESLQRAYLPIMFTVLLVLLIVITFGIIFSRAIVGPIMVLSRATKDIASGNLDLRINLRTNDELQQLADTFDDMTAALKKMRGRAEDANPLTRLPGNNVIREEVENRIRDKQKFVVIHTDLDNFKAFNDKYGLARGDEAIKITSRVIQEGLEEKGGAGDFLGHGGGDDFVLITRPETADAVASYIIENFDKRIRGLYSREDLKSGYIVSKNREGKISKFPVMTISLSGVSNLYRPLESYAEVTNIEADIKKKVKAVGKSIYLLDKRAERV